MSQYSSVLNQVIFFPEDFLLVYVVNLPATADNLVMLDSFNNVVPVIDNIAKHVVSSKVSQILSKDQSVTGGVAGIL